MVVVRNAVIVGPLGLVAGIVQKSWPLFIGSILYILFNLFLREWIRRKEMT